MKIYDMLSPVAKAHIDHMRELSAPAPIRQAVRLRELRLASRNNLNDYWSKAVSVVTSEDSDENR